MNGTITIVCFAILRCMSVDSIKT